MSAPVEVNLPHKLGREGAKQRIAGGFGRLADFIPGGAVTAHQWTGDTLEFTVEGMGQRVSARLDVQDTNIHAVFDLPPMLALFAEKIRAKLVKEGPALLK